MAVASFAVILAATWALGGSPATEPPATTSPAAHGASTPLFILSRPTYGFAGDWQGYGAPLIRELQRQAVVIAADRAGAHAVDVVVTPPATMPADAERIEPRADQRFDPTLHLSVTLDGNEVDHLDQTFDWHGTTMPPFDAFAAMIAPRIDHEYASVLSRLSAHAAPTTTMTSASLPQTIEPLLLRPDLFAAFRAARLTHLAIDQDGGESPVRLSALARAYANLGESVRPLVTMQYDAFFARSLLYAERLVAAKPDEAASFWTRAYARVFVGLDDLARLDVQRAEQIGGPAPDWGTTVKAYLDRNLDALQQAHADPSIAPINAHLAMRLAEFDGSQGEVVAAARAASAADPLDLRAWLLIDDAGDFGDKRESTDLTPTRLNDGLASIAQWNELPPGLRSAVAAAQGASFDANARLALWGALDREPDANPLPWATLASLSREATVVLAERKLEFLRYDYGVDATDELAAWWPLVKDHPCASIIASFGNAPDRTALVAFDVQDTPGSFYRFSGQLAREGITRHPSGITWWDRINHYGDATSYDLGEALQRGIDGCPDEWVKANGKQLLKRDPESPIGLASLIKADWPSVEALKDDLQARSQHEYRVARALALHYADAHDLDGVLRILPGACDRWPDWKLTEMLADAYRRKGDLDHEIATWTHFIEKSPERGLSHGAAHAQIADVLLPQDRVADALPHAEEAAKTYAQWGLEVYAEALFRSGRFDDASAVMQRIAERYGGPGFGTYFYYRMSGSRGDADAVRDFLQKQSDWADSADAGERLMHASIVYIDDGRRATLDRELEREVLEAGNDGAAALMLAGFQMQEGKRDKALKTLEPIARSQDQTPDGVSHHYVAQLVRYVVGNPAAGVPPLPKDNLDASTASYGDPEARAIDAWAVGAACELTGHVDRAVEWYRFAVRQPAPAAVRLFVAARLHKLGKEPFATTQP